MRGGKRGFVDLEGALEQRLSVGEPIRLLVMDGQIVKAKGPEINEWLVFGTDGKNKLKRIPTGNGVMQDWQHDSVTEKRIISFTPTKNDAYVSTLFIYNPYASRVPSIERP